MKNKGYTIIITTIVITLLASVFICYNSYNNELHEIEQIKSSLKTEMDKYRDIYELCLLDLEDYTLKKDGYEFRKSLCENTTKRYTEMWILYEYFGQSISVEFANEMLTELNSNIRIDSQSD